LHQDAGAVTGQRVGPDSTAVRQVLQYAQALPDDFMALASLEVGDKPDTTGIVFVGRVIQALSRWQCSMLHWNDSLCDGILPVTLAGRQEMPLKNSALQMRAA
jgi:hypothetical protein